jgi:hypothetical protein
MASSIRRQRERERTDGSGCGTVQWQEWAPSGLQGSRDSSLQRRPQSKVVVAFVVCCREEGTAQARMQCLDATVVRAQRGKNYRK